MKAKTMAMGILAAALVSGAAVAKDGRRAEQMFKRADTNGNGAISATEARAFRDARFARMDVNGDGAVTLEEMTEAARKRSAERVAKMFERADRNGDGVIQRTEFEDRGARRFEMLDADGDGSVTLEEIQARKGRRRGG